MICVSIGRTRHKMVILEHRALAERGAELVELRLDWLSRIPDLGRLLKDVPTPVIATCRRPEEQGRWRGSEEQRLSLLRAAILQEVSYIDLEMDIAASIPRYGKTKRIISHHDFEKTPEKLSDIHKEMKKLDADIIKIVTMAHSPADVIRMLRLVKDASIPTIGFCMGEQGLPSRILCGKYGSPWTYATFSHERELAPGQLSFDVMKNLYHYDQIDENTQVFGVLGDPIGHSYSPHLHNAAFREAGINAVYLPFRVQKKGLLPALEQYNWLDIKGYSVTIPHKEEAMKFAGEVDSLAKSIGAVNTLYRKDDGSWRATNTDCMAAIDSLLEGYRQSDREPKFPGKQVLIIGAGGVARAVGFGLKEQECKITITNRTHQRAVKLAKELDCQEIKWENRASVAAELIVNCTSLGMHPDVNDTPYEDHWLNEIMMVFDTVYNPENTLLLKHAKERGCPTVSGLEMFIRQAAAQFKLFTGQEAPLDRMREQLRQCISVIRK